VSKPSVNDRAGNVREIFYNASNETVLLRQFTGRSPNPDLPTDDASNRPVGRLRPGDPAFFESRYSYDSEFLLARIDRPNGGSTLYTYEAELTPGGPRVAQGNLRQLRRLAGPLGGDQTEILQSWTYDPIFNVATQYTDPRGHADVSTLDAAGNVIHVQHRLPAIVEDWEHNGFGQVTAHVLPDNGSAHRRRDEFTYYSAGSHAGYLATEDLDAGGLGLTTAYDYDALGNLVGRVDPRGHDVMYVVNSLGQIQRELSSETADGSGTRYEEDTYYDADDDISRIDVENRDDQGFVQPNAFFTTSYTFDALDRRSSSTREVDTSRSMGQSYKTDANDHRVLDVGGEAVNGHRPKDMQKELYDERDLLWRTVRAEGGPDQSTDQTDYDGDGNVVAVRRGLEASPRVTTMAFDGFDRLTSRTDPMGNVTTYHYDAGGNVTSVRTDGELDDVPGCGANVRLSEVQYTYDDMDRVVRSEVSHFDSASQVPIGDGSATTQTRYNDNGQVVEEIDDGGHSRRTTYDTANRIATITDAKGNVISYSYDAAGNAVSVSERETSDLGSTDQVFVTTRDFDPLNRLIKEKDNAGNARVYRYDSRDERTSVQDPEGHEVRTAFDGIGRPTTIAVDLDGGGANPGDPADLVTIDTWDDDSRLTSTTDDNGHTTSPQYDDLGRPTSMLMADQTHSGESFDVHGNAVTVTDANGSVVTYSYDLDDRVTGKVVVPGSGVSAVTTFESFRYDGLGRLVGASNDVSAVTRSYDSMGNVTRETQDLAGAGPMATVTAVYDGLGNMTRCVYPGGRTITTVYDALNRKSVISDGGTTIATYAYRGPRRVERRELGNATRLDIAYDGIVPNPPGDFGVRRPVRTTHSTIGSSQVLDDRAYTWNRDGRKTSRKDMRAGGPQWSASYGLDAIDRLVRATVRDALGTIARDTTYSLDALGNRASVTGPGTPDAGFYTEDATFPVDDSEVNQYTTTPTGARTYDAQGNLVAIAGTAALRYDFANRMVEYRDAATNVRHVYSYDALGRRIAKIDDADGVAGGPVQTRFLLDGWQEIEDRDFAGNAQATYVYGDYVDEILNMRRGITDTWFQGDDLFNVTAITDSAGNVLQRFEYGDYGQRLDPGTLAPLTPGDTSLSPFLFGGHRYDPESAWLYARTRYIDPRAGRFITRDGHGHDDDLNLYQYADDSPGSFADPFGLQKNPDDEMIEQQKKRLEKIGGVIAETGAGACCGLDVTDNIKGGLKTLEKKFKALDVKKQREICSGVRSVTGWDISTLIGENPKNFLTRGRCGKAGCEETVTYDGKCHWAFAVNYVLWGRINRLCHDNVTVTKERHEVTLKEDKWVTVEVPAGLSKDATIDMAKTYRQIKTLKDWKGIEAPVSWTKVGWTDDFSLVPEAQRDCEACEHKAGKSGTMWRLVPIGWGSDTEALMEFNE
jgi:RHS repeat-associated protein